MRKVVLVAIAAVSLGACGKANALAPDSENPAHCIAAYNYATYWLSMKESYRPRVVVEIAKGLYEMSKLKASGASITAAKVESERLTRAYANDAEAMDELHKSCTKALRDDPEFKRQFPALIESAKPLAATFRPGKS